MKRIVALTLAVLLVAALFAGCSGSSSSPAGSYVLTGMNGKTVEEALQEEMGDLMSIEDLLGMLGIESMEELMTLELKSDGTAVMSSKMTDEASANGTWTQDGNKIIITVDDEPVEFTMEGNTLTGAEDDMTLTFTKK